MSLNRIHAARGWCHGRLGRRMASALLALLAASGDALAQLPGRDIASLTLEELMAVSVTTATRTEETVANAPARIEVVTAEQIRVRGYRSLTDVLEDLPEFKVELAGDQDYPVEFAVQGMRGASRLIVLLDGVRVSSPTNEPLPILANYPVHMAQQIEIVHGPASAVYGADAFSGVINIITRKGADAPGLTASSSYGQHGLTNQTVSFGRPIGVSGSLMLGGQVLYDRQPDLSRFYPEDFGGMQAQRRGVFETIYGPMVPARTPSHEYENPLAARSFQAALHAGGISLTLFANQAQASTTPAYTPENGVYDADAFNRNTLVVGSAGYTRAIGSATSSSTVTFSRHELAPESGYWNVFSNLKKSYKYAFGAMVKADEQLTWKPRRAVTVSVGATHERFFAIPQGADLNLPVTSRDRPGTILDTDIVDEFVKLRYSNTGAYGQLQYSVTPGISATLGARGDYNSRYGATFNPRAGVVLRPAHATTVKVLYGTAFLAPSPYESYAHYGSFYSVDGGQTYASEFWHLANPNLKPQTKKTLEVNLVQRVGPSVALSGSAFYSRVMNLLIAKDPDQAYSGTYLGWPVSYIEFPVNEGDATRYGGTLGAELFRTFGLNRSLSARATLALADGRTSHNYADGSAGYVPVGGMAPVQFKASTDLVWGEWSVAPRYTIVGRQRHIATEDVDGETRRRTLAGYSVLDATIRRTVSRRLDVHATIENALDGRYRHLNSRAYTNPEELIGAPQNPRRLTAGVTVRLP
jgi:outer membrane cobalamin receptor